LEFLYAGLAEKTCRLARIAAWGSRVGHEEIVWAKLKAMARAHASPARSSGPTNPRRWPWQVSSLAPADAFLNRGKRRITLALKTTEGVATAQCLIDSADVVIENFWSPTTAASLLLPLRMNSTTCSAVGFPGR